MTRLLVRVLHNRRFKPLAEALVGVQIPRHQEIEDRPELAQPVFNRRAGQREAMRRVERLDGLRRLRRGVFDVLRLVEQHMRQRLIPIGQHVPAELIVGCDQKPVAPGLDLLLANGRRAQQRHAGQIGRKPRRLAAPVELERRGADHQRAHRPPARPLTQQQRQRLHRLAQPHVVRQNAAEARVAQRAQPRKPRPLIGAQFGAEPARRLNLRLLRVLQPPHPLAERLGHIQRNALALGERLFQIHRPFQRHFAAALGVLHAQAGAFQHLFKLRRLIERLLREEGAVLQPHILPLLAVCGVGRVQIRLRQPAQIRVNEQLRALPLHAEGDRAGRFHVHPRQPVGNHDLADGVQFAQALRQQRIAPVVVAVKRIFPFGSLLGKERLNPRKRLIFPERIPPDVRRGLAGAHTFRAVMPLRAAEQRVLLVRIQVKPGGHLHRRVAQHDFAPLNHLRAGGRDDLRADGRNLLLLKGQAVRALRRGVQKRLHPAEIRAVCADHARRQKLVCAGKPQRHIRRFDAQLRAAVARFQRHGGRDFPRPHRNANRVFPILFQLHLAPEQNAHRLIQQRAFQRESRDVLPDPLLREQQRQIDQRNIPFVKHLAVVRKRQPLAVGMMLAAQHALREIPRVADDVGARPFPADPKLQRGDFHPPALDHGIQAHPAPRRPRGIRPNPVAQIHHLIDECPVQALFLRLPPFFLLLTPSFLLLTPLLLLPFMFHLHHVLDHQRDDVLTRHVRARMRHAGASAPNLPPRFLIPRIVYAVMPAHPRRIALLRAGLPVNEQNPPFTHVFNRPLYRRLVVYHLINIFHVQHNPCPPSSVCFIIAYLRRFFEPDFASFYFVITRLY